MTNPESHLLERLVFISQSSQSNQEESQGSPNRRVE